MTFRRGVSSRGSLFKPDARTVLVLACFFYPSSILSVGKKTTILCLSAGGQTNARVRQRSFILPSMDRYVPSVVDIVRTSMNAFERHKIVAFFPTARMAGFFSDLLVHVLGISSSRVIELHSKKGQGYRNRASENFRKAERGILMTSDVSARGKLSWFTFQTRRADRTVACLLFYPSSTLSPRT